MPLSPLPLEDDGKVAAAGDGDGNEDAFAEEEEENTGVFSSNIV